MKSIYQGFDVRQYKDKLDRAITRYGPPKRSYPIPIRDLEWRVSDVLGYMQPSAPLYWQCYIYQALTNNGVLDRDDVYAITILDQRWHFGEYQWNFVPEKMKLQVRRTLKGLDFLVMIEFEIFGNRFYLEEWVEDGVDHIRSRGRLITPHIQGLLWGKHPSRRQRAQFAGGVDNAPSVKLIPLSNLAGAVRYLVKPPYMGRLVHVRPDGRRVRYPWVNMPLKLHHLMFCELYDFSYPDLTFAGGEGRAILAHAKRLWRDYDLCGLRRYDFPQQPFHQIGLRRRPD